jgi:hypothetical protein
MTAQYNVTTGLTALVANTAKTFIEITPESAGNPAELIALRVSSSYLTVGTPLALIVEVGTYSATGTGSSFTPKRVGQAVGTAKSVVKINDTVEPAGFTAIDVWDLVLPGDRLDYLWPLGREFFLGAGTVSGVRLTAPVGTPSCRVTAWFEE